jgi:hypothetical protein
MEELCKVPVADARECECLANGDHPSAQGRSQMHKKAKVVPPRDAVIAGYHVATCDLSNTL